MRIYLIYPVLICVMLTVNDGIHAEGKNPFKLPEDVKESSDNKKDLSSINFVDADIGDVLRTLAERFRLNIVAGTDIKGKVTVSLSNVALDDALTSILRVNGYDYVKKARII